MREMKRQGMLEQLGWGRLTGKVLDLARVRTQGRRVLQGEVKKMGRMELQGMVTLRLPQGCWQQLGNCLGWESSVLQEG